MNRRQMFGIGEGGLYSSRESYERAEDEEEGRFRSELPKNAKSNI